MKWSLVGHKEDPQHQVGQRDVDDEQVLGTASAREDLARRKDDEGQVAGQDPDGQRQAADVEAVPRR